MQGILINPCIFGYWELFPPQQFSNSLKTLYCYENEFESGTYIISKYNYEYTSFTSMLCDKIYSNNNHIQTLSKIPHKKIRLLTKVKGKLNNNYILKD